MKKKRPVSVSLFAFGLLTFILVVLISSISDAATLVPRGYADGYTFEPEEERYLYSYELSYVQDPERNLPLLTTIIFDQKLEKEFSERYEQKFGFTEVDQNFSAPNRFAEQEYQAGVWVTPQEDQDRRRDFGEFMVRRLAEHHLDNYARSRPSIRPVYQLKENLSNVDFEVKGGFKFNARYSLSGNYVNLIFSNPYEIYTRFTWELDEVDLYAEEPKQSRLYLSYPLSQKVTIATDLFVDTGGVSLIGRRHLGGQLYGTVTSSSKVYVGNKVPEDRVILGLTWQN